MNPDGTMARLPELLEMAERLGLRISIEETPHHTGWPMTP